MQERPTARGFNLVSKHSTSNDWGGGEGSQALIMDMRQQEGCLHPASSVYEQFRRQVPCKMLSGQLLLRLRFLKSERQRPYGIY
jgi:hypothetical protein